MNHEDDWALKLAIPLVILLGVMYLVNPSDTGTTGFVVYDTDYVEFNSLDPIQVNAFKSLIDDRFRGYEPFYKEATHYTFGCATSEGKILIETLNTQIHSVEDIAEQATTRCTGRVYWRGGRQ